MEFENFEKKCIDVNGFIENGKQFDVDVRIPKDNRNVVFGTVKDEYGDVIPDAVVKLIEVEKMMGKTERKPVSHTFTNENGEFVFGPLCPEKSYDLQIWVNRVKHIKICHSVNLKRPHCLKGEKIECKKFDNGCPGGVGPVMPKEENENLGSCPLLDM
jgi:hypothetical protein